MTEFWILDFSVAGIVTFALVWVSLSFRRMERLLDRHIEEGSLDIGLLLALVLPLIPIILLLALIGVVTDVALRDWMMPHYALENATAGQAWSRVWTAIKAEKAQFLVYTLLRLILPTIAGIALFMVLLIPGLILAGSLGVVEYGLHSTFAHATGASAVAGIALEVFFGVLGFAFMVLFGICLVDR